MVTSDGKCKINGVAVGEATFDLLGPAPALSVKYALCSTESVLRYGAGFRNQGWSEETMKCLRTLADSIERDICSDVFEGNTSGCVEGDDLGTSDGVPGF
jgi:hypothetical protein